ncbi:hypothetical protein P9199_16750 [Geobacillus stearothermophilus]|nr:hypothetical protein [Geobacillus stearothermophilus]AKM18847.1 hypothetical protein GARCT_01559 [Geobacillus sp. 12AMOR1]MED4879131.1 hypothetical protein [Anoxybacillus geothermalis]STO12053.1 Uncharacterised protein [[Flavobacterium] thermophilum]MED4271727.1 hypothetical protein [Geobacillus stearothermophilus]MED4923090.1 hypothetical protein [Anoxybacillus geothermalis]
MPVLLSVGTATMPYTAAQDEVKQHVSSLFSGRMARVPLGVGRFCSRFF